MPQKLRNDIRWQAIENLARTHGDGIIYEYILYQMSNYTEPTREGTPKGDRIGFPHNKYFASILCGITNYNLKKIAEISGISYGVIRKWRTEEDFKSACDKHCSDFVNEIIHRTNQRLGKMSRAIENFVSGQGQHPRRTNLNSPLDPAERVMIDAKHFNNNVLDKLTSASLCIATTPCSGEISNLNKPDWGLAMSLGQVVSYAKSGNFLRLPSRLLAIWANTVRELIASKNTLSDNEQKMAILYLDIIKDNLDDSLPVSKS
jgi:hypothetical protein